MIKADSFRLLRLPDVDCGGIERGDRSVGGTNLPGWGRSPSLHGPSLNVNGRDPAAAHSWRWLMAGAPRSFPTPTGVRVHLLLLLLLDLV